MLIRLRAEAPPLARIDGVDSAALPDGFGEDHPQVLALGGDIKNDFGSARSGSVVLSQHIGDLGEMTALADLERTIGLYEHLYDLTPALVVADLHPGCHATWLARDLADARNLPLIRVAHHHAHAAACMAEHGLPRDHLPVLALVQDGIGMGPDGTLWGAELLLCDYAAARRLASLRPAALPGGDLAAMQPWRNLLARLARIGHRRTGPDRWPSGWRITRQSPCTRRSMPGSTPRWPCLPGGLLMRWPPPPASVPSVRPMKARPRCCCNPAPNGTCGRTGRRQAMPSRPTPGPTVCT